MQPAVNLSSDPSTGGSLFERAYTHLRDMVVTLEIPPGAPINEEQLSKELDLGRTPIREAIKRLEAEGLVAIYPRRGTFATKVDIADHALITDVRRVLEGHAAQRAAERATAADREALAELIESIRSRHSSADELMQLDTTIHREVYRCTYNPFLAATLHQYYNLALRIWYLFLDRLPDMTSHLDEHIPLLEAIANGEAERAHTVASEHVTSFERTVRETL